MSYLRVGSISSDELCLLGESSVFRRLNCNETRVLFIDFDNRPSFFLDLFDAFAIFDVVQELSVSVALLAPRAFEFQNIHKVFELNIDLNQPIRLMAHRTFQLTISTAACAK